MNCFLSFFLTTVFLLTQPGQATSTTEEDVPDSIRVAIQTGDAHYLAASFDKTLEFVIDSESVNFSSIRAGHAEVILDGFFKKHPPSRFRFVQTGASNRLQYGTGVYQSSGETFSVYITLRRTETNEYVINALQFRQTA